MTKAKFDFEGLFGQDYLYLYDFLFTPERTELEVELIWQLPGFKAGNEGSRPGLWKPI